MMLKQFSAADKAVCGLFLLVAVVVMTTFRDYGYSWDEVWQGRWYGQAVLQFIGSFGADRSATSTANFYLYGGTFDVLAELLVAISPLEPRNARHLANAVTGILALLGCWRVARYLGGPESGFWAVLFLFVCAPFYGHMFINGKDIPFAAGYIWSLYFLLRINQRFFDPPLRTRLLLGMCIGLTLGVRVGGVLIFFYYLFMAVRNLLSSSRFDPVTWKAERPVSGAVLHFLPVVILAYLLMLACWPAALLSPIRTPLLALRTVSHFDWPATVLWNGQILWGDQLPWNFIPVIYGVQLPEILTILFLLTILWGGVCGFKALRKERRVSAPGLGALWLATLFPPVWAILTHAVVYDNARHFLFVLPPLVCLVALFWGRVLDFVQRKFRRGRWVFSGGMILLLMIPFGRMIQLHPYEYTFFNRFSGGIPQAAKKFETDYWITSYREAGESVIRHAHSVAKAKGVPFDSLRFSVMTVAPSPDMLDNLSANMDVMPLNLNQRTDYLIATTRWNMDQKWLDWPVVHAVSREGMVFAVVRCSPKLAQLVSLEEKVFAGNYIK